MSLLELFIIAVGLSIDAFAVAVCKGLSMEKVTVKKALTVGLYFGIFQAGMPLIGYFLGSQFKAAIESVDHWIAFVLLALIDANMIKESVHKDKLEVRDDSLKFSKMIVLAISTSIDALAVGITFALLKVNMSFAALFIGMTTLMLSILGVKIGNVFGIKYKSKAEFAGGIILILMGLKILLQHLEVINF
jgi:putative Mn2+ efflux pump MntP